MRVKAVIAYNGAHFNGFQKQKNTANTIVETIEKALYSLGIESKIVGSGRTDKGVHATGQVIHFDLPSFWQKQSLEKLKNLLNQRLHYIEFKDIKKVDSSFHAQYKAKKRIYKYIIKQKRVSVFEKDFVSHYKIYDFKTFTKAIKLFENTHNFAYFKKEGSFTSTTIRTIYKTKVIRKKDFIICYFIANGYLRSQIRMMIAAAIAAANGKITLQAISEQLTLQKKHINTLASPNGLYLAKVIY